MTAKKSTVTKRTLNFGQPKQDIPKPDPAPPKPVSPPLVKSTVNPEYEEFEALVDTVRKAIRRDMDYRRSNNDLDPVSIELHTGNIIKELVRASKWA